MGLFSCSCENDPYGKAMDLFPESSYPTFSFANGARRMVAPSGRVYSLHSSWATYVGHKYPLERWLKDEGCDSLDSFFRKVRTFDLVRVFPFSRYQELTLPEMDALRYFCIETADGGYARCFSVMQHELQRGMKALWGDNTPALIKDEYDNNLRIVRGLIARHETPAEAHASSAATPPVITHNTGATNATQPELPGLWPDGVLDSCVITVPLEQQEEPEPGPWFTDWLPPTGDDQ